MVPPRAVTAIASLDGAFADAVALHGQGRLADAERAYRAILAAAPAYAPALRNLGVLAMQAGQPDAALALLGQALAAAPNSPETLYNLGYVLMAVGRAAEAELRLRQALAAAPGYVDALANLGSLLTTQDRLDEAEPLLRQAIRLGPWHVGALNNLGALLARRGRHDDAAACFQAACAADPALPLSRINLGTALLQGGRIEAAIAALQAGLAGDPSHVEGRFNLAWALLLAGRFAEGWAAYEARWQRPELAPLLARFACPAWDGREPAGKTLLLHGEQGFGDAIQFIRYAALLAERGARVLFLADGPRARLARLFRTAPGLAGCVDSIEAAGPVDSHAPLMRLPRLLGTGDGSIPAAIPYLRAEPAKVAEWRDRLPPGYRVGVVWQASQDNAHGRRRSLPLAALAPLAALPGVRLVSLQHAASEADRAALATLGILPVGEALDRGDDGFVDTAAVLDNLDLVIGCDTAVPHLAGALGRPVWLLLEPVPDWRWRLDTDGSAWYPTMRLYRAGTDRNWAPVIAQVAVDLQALSSSQAI